MFKNLRRLAAGFLGRHGTRPMKRVRDSYLNFDLHVEPTGRPGFYRATWRSDAQGEFSNELALTIEEGEDTVLPPTELKAVRAGLPSAVEDAKGLGDRLFKALLGGDVLARFQQERLRARERGEGLRLRLWLTTTPELARLPWELLFEASGGSFLLHDPEISLVRYLEAKIPPRPLRLRPPINVLVAASSPVGLSPVDAEQELRRIEGSLGDLRRSRRVFLDPLQPATRTSLREHLRKLDYHVFHFIGHGEQGPDAPQGVLVLEDERRKPDPLDGDDLKAFLQDRPSLRLVVLNACQGGWAAESNPFAGLAQPLVRQGIPAVVAMQSRITDRAAISFARFFYEEIAQGASVDRSVARARIEMVREGAKVEWAAPVLFMWSADGRLFGIRSVFSLRRLFATAVFLGLLLTVLQGFDPLRAWWWALLAERARDEKPVPIRVDGRLCPSPPGVEIPFVLIRPGVFQMGSIRGSAEARPPHRVTLTRAFCAGVYEVTQGQWHSVMGRDSDISRVRGDYLPVTGVSWSDADAFVRELDRRHPGANYRLLTEAQWEYAAREGTGAGTSPVAATARFPNCLRAGYDEPIRVGLSKPNRWGLYDMVGNVSEWVADRYDLYEPFLATDPTGPTFGDYRVRRGGAFDSSDENCTSLERTKMAPERRQQNVGFRIARDPVAALP